MKTTEKLLQPTLFLAPPILIMICLEEIKTNLISAFVLVFIFVEFFIALSNN